MQNVEWVVKMPLVCERIYTWTFFRRSPYWESTSSFSINPTLQVCSSEADYTLAGTGSGHHIEDLKNNHLQYSKMLTLGEKSMLLRLTEGIQLISWSPGPRKGSIESSATRTDGEIFVQLSVRKGFIYYIYHSRVLAYLSFAHLLICHCLLPKSLYLIKISEDKILISTLHNITCGFT